MASINYNQPDYVEKRPRYFDGQFLSVKDFVDEQQYHIDRQQRVSRFLHVSGILDGLDVQLTSDNQNKKLRLSPGTAISPGQKEAASGAQILLNKNAKINGQKITNSGSSKYFYIDLADLPNGAYRLSIKHNEEESDNQADEGSGENTRFEQFPIISLDPWETTDDTTVVLARVQIPTGNTPLLDTSVRQYSGLRLPNGTKAGITLQADGTRSDLAILSGSLSVTNAVEAQSLNIAGNTNLHGQLEVKGKVGLNTTVPRTEFDTGLGVMSGAANDYQKAQFALSGGGKIIWGGPGGRLKWDKRFIAISTEKSRTFSSGHIDIVQPNNIPTQNIYDRTVRAAAEGILLKAWDALYAVHEVGGSNENISFQIVHYQHVFYAPSNWILVAIVNGDDQTVKLGTGLVLSKNSSSSHGSPLPSGTILMWSGSETNIPDGWILCNAYNNSQTRGLVPDLSGKFIFGGGSSSYPIGSSGGEAKVTLKTNEIPSHTHGITDAGHEHSFEYWGAKWIRSDDANDRDVGAPTPGSSRTQKATTGILINSAGGGESHNNMPPYYVLCFIMKL